MSTIREYSQNLQREIHINIETLLDAVRHLSSDGVTQFAENEHAHRVQVGEVTYDSYTQLAEAFGLDIRDYAVGEVTR